MFQGILAQFISKDSQEFEEIERLYILINTLLDKQSVTDDTLSQCDYTDMQQDTFNHQEDNLKSDTLSEINDEFHSDTCSQLNENDKEDNFIERTNKINKIIAANRIKNFVTKYIYKNRFINQSYNTYMSLLEPHDQRLSAAIFGRHQAEISKKYPDHIPNPYNAEDANYQRICPINKELLERLVSRVTQCNFEKFYYYPFPLLNSTSIDEVLREFKLKISSKKSTEVYDLCFDFLFEEIDLFTDPETMTVGVIAWPKLNNELSRKYNTFIKKHYNKEQRCSKKEFTGLTKYYYRNLNDFLNSCGFKASPFEIAINIEHSNTQIPFHNIALFVPDNQTQLFESKIYSDLIKISESNYNSKSLAIAVIKLLDGTLYLTENSIKRISLFIDIANTFYFNNYSQYSFYLYCIVHEISLALLKDNPENKEALLEKFETKCRTTILKAMDVIDNNSITYATLAAMSGSHAHFLALQLTNLIFHDSRPDFITFTPAYYEFKKLYKNQVDIDIADIFEISTGPICAENGVNCGIDINDFIQYYITGEKLSILLIDITTTMYRKLKLDDYAKQLINNGMLIILMHESGQKTHLLHTDQAQYGQVHIVCHNEFTYKINDLLQRGKKDFLSHIDLLIGGFIRTQCEEIVEYNKEKHFQNGFIMRQMITADTNEFVVESNVPINLEETFFIVCDNEALKKSIAKVIPERESFGHYETTYAIVLEKFRLCAGASDIYDILLESAEICLHQYPLKKLFELFCDFKNITNILSKTEQIIILALANVVMNNLDSIMRLSIEHVDLEIYSPLKKILHLSYNDFFGRLHYSNLQNYYYGLSKIYYQRLTENLETFKKMHATGNYIVKDIYTINKKYLDFWENYPDEFKKHLKKFEDFVLENIKFTLDGKDVIAKDMETDDIVNQYNQLYDTNGDKCTLLLLRLVLDIKDLQAVINDTTKDLIEPALETSKKEVRTTRSANSDYQPQFFNTLRSYDIENNSQKRRHSI